MTQMQFWKGFHHGIKARVYSNQLKRLRDNFQGLKWVLIQEMTKMPFFMILANKVEIKCREICNWSETISNDLRCKKTFVWFQIQENIDKITAENIFKHRQ
jgi:hypothetical protein